MNLEAILEDPGIDDRLVRLRADDRQRRLTVLGGVLIGLGFGSLHWFGLVLGGAIIALPARSIPRGLAAGLGLGLLELLIFAALLTWQGALGPVLSTGMVGAITVVIGLAAPFLGSLVRALV
jgi:hypothetical protein